MTLRGFFRSQNHRSRSIIYTRSISCSDGPRSSKRRLQLRESLQGSVGARMFVADDARRPFFPRNVHCNNFLRKKSVCLRASRTLLASQRERVLILSAYRKFLRDVFSRFGHRIHSILLLHQRIDEPPANRCVISLRRPRKRRLRLSHDEWRSRH